jgi:alginate O-acetyltransferase complex protein AlgI
MLGLDYFSGIRIREARTNQARRLWFGISIGINLGFLCIFKYFNFFAASFAEGMSLLGLHAHLSTLEIVLPVGISFYTFHGLSYIIDIYQQRIEPERKFLPYAVFVSFFPLLVAGPIERATHLLPQIIKPREFTQSKAVDGLRQILWGLFKKIVIADNCAVYVNEIFGDVGHQTGGNLAFGAVLFTIQVYCDFSGYSDIALGSARLFGIDLIQNFNFPLFSRSMTEFWRRWHISLSTWIRDYLYTPLALRTRNWGRWGIAFSLLVSFTLNGLWHGANWTYIVWGALHGFAMVYEAMTVRLRIRLGNLLPSALNRSLSIGFVFAFWTFSLILFRADHLHEAIDYISKMFSSSLLTLQVSAPKKLFLLLGLFFVVELLGRKYQYGFQFVEKIKGMYARIFLYYAVVLLILFFGNFYENQFIYFQF